jgi:hypothetical protein
MKNKKTLVIVGVVAVAGIGLYLWNRSRKSETTSESDKSSDGKSTSSEPVKIGDTELVIKPVSTMMQNVSSSRNPVSSVQSPKEQGIKLTKFELETRMLRLCGIRPRFKNTPKFRLYEQCLRTEKEKLRNQGYISFEGENESIVSPSFYSSFESNMYLDI